MLYRRGGRKFRRERGELSPRTYSPGSIAKGMRPSREDVTVENTSTLLSWTSLCSSPYYFNIKKRNVIHPIVTHETSTSSHLYLHSCMYLLCMNIYVHIRADTHTHVTHQIPPFDLVIRVFGDIFIREMCSKWLNFLHVISVSSNSKKCFFSHWLDTHSTHKRASRSEMLQCNGEQWKKLFFVSTSENQTIITFPKVNSVQNWKKYTKDECSSISVSRLVRRSRIIVPDSRLSFRQRDIRYTFIRYEFSPDDNTIFIPYCTRMVSVWGTDFLLDSDERALRNLWAWKSEPREMFGRASDLLVFIKVFLFPF